MKCCVFITKTNQINSFDTAIFKEYFPIVFNLRIEHWVKKLNIEYKTIWDFIDIDDFEGLELKVNKFCNHWLDHIKHHLVYDEIDFFEAARFYPLYFIRHYHILSLFAKRFIEKNPDLKNVMLDTSLRDPFFTIQEHDVWEATIIHEMQRRGITIVSLPEFFSVKINKEQKSIEKKVICSNKINLFESQKFNIVFYGFSIDFINAESWIMRLKQEIPNSEFFLLQTTNHKVDNKINTINLNDVAIEDADLKTARICFDSFLEKFYESGNRNVYSNTKDIIKNRFLHFQINYLFKNVFEQVYLLSKRVRKLFPRDHRFLLLSGLNYQFPVRSIVLECNRMKIPTVQLCHGSVLSPLQFNSVSNFTEIWGKGMAEQLKGINDKMKMKITGSRFHDRYFNLYKIKTNQRNTIQNILLLDTRIPEFDSYGVVNFSKHLEVYSEVLTSLSNHNEYKIKIKSHPRGNYREAILDTINNYQNIKLLDIGFDTLTAIEKSDLVIGINVSTTFFIDAMIMNKPVIFIKQGAEFYGPPYHKYQSVVVVETIKDLLTSLKRLENDIEYKNELLRNQKRFLKDYIIFDGKSEDRLIGFIKDKYLSQRIS